MKGKTVPAKWDSPFYNIYNGILFCKIGGDMICLSCKNFTQLPCFTTYHKERNKLCHRHKC